MKGKKIKPSWEGSKFEDYGTHSKEGIERLKAEVKFGLNKKYMGMAEEMFRWEFPKEFDDMRVMSEDIMPEYLMLKNGKAVWFKDPATDEYHILPLVMKGGLNMYGRMVRWSPVPIGSVDVPGGSENNPALDRIRNLVLDANNSVVMLNDRFGGNDEGFIDAMIDELVDNMLTANQLQLLAKCPYVFAIPEDRMLDAKNMYLAIASDAPVYFTTPLGAEEGVNVQSTGVKIDPALFDLFDRWECQILEYIGIECVPITKRAQQTVSEVQSNQDKIYLRRQEKLNRRLYACERLKEVFGVDVKVHSVIDERMEEMRNEADDRNDAGADVAAAAD